MSNDLIVTIVAIGGGFLAGIVNTLAGNGSAITLGIMTELMGLPPNTANGTNRVGVLMQSLSSNAAFIKNRKLDFTGSSKSIFTCLAGAIVGIVVALNVSNDQFRIVFQYLLVVMFFVLLINPKRWLKKSSGPQRMNAPITLILFFLLGFYGGFIQMGMGIVFLIVTVLFLKYDLISANVLKTAVVGLYTIVAVGLFHWKGLIDWKVGLTIGIGQAIGGYITAEFASKYPKANVWAYYLLVMMVLLAILSSFGILDFKISNN